METTKPRPVLTNVLLVEDGRSQSGSKRGERKRVWRCDETYESIIPLVLGFSIEISLGLALKQSLIGYINSLTNKKIRSEKAPSIRAQELGKTTQT